MAILRSDSGYRVGPWPFLFDRHPFEAEAPTSLSGGGRCKPRPLWKLGVGVQVGGRASSPRDGSGASDGTDSSLRTMVQFSVRGREYGAGHVGVPRVVDSEVQKTNLPPGLSW